jgi:hypothetical protein
MEILARIIIAIIKEMAKDKPSKKITPVGWEAVEQQKLATEQKIREMQAAIAKQQARTKPVRNRGPSRGAAVAPRAKAVPTLTQTPDAYTAPISTSGAPLAVSDMRGRAPLRELRVPFILGEILAPPVALREPEF